MLGLFLPVKKVSSAAGLLPAIWHQNLLACGALLLLGSCSPAAAEPLCMPELVKPASGQCEHTGLGSYFTHLMKS